MELADNWLGLFLTWFCLVVTYHISGWMLRPEMSRFSSTELLEGLLSLQVHSFWSVFTVLSLHGFPDLLVFLQIVNFT